MPMFSGHRQPILPERLGFYDLRSADVLRKQAELARNFGVHGFCFHHYWFAGRRLLERPLDLLLADRSIDLPFCINWANENWTRRWDGKDQEVLLGQQHSPEDDLAFARSVERIFDDPRYIRCGDRPLFLLYRPGLLPDAAATVDRWRDHFEARGVSPLFLMVQGSGDEDPRKFRMDGAVGFPPFGTPVHAKQIYPEQVYDPGFRGVVRDYRELVQQSLSFQPKDYRFYPAVCPSWDNSARKDRKGEQLKMPPHTRLTAHTPSPKDWASQLTR